MKEFTQLQYFRVVARLENTTKAAEELHVSQPNLSRAIKRLENDLGIPLFVREKGRLRLSSYGEEYLSCVDRAFSILEAGEARLRNQYLSDRKTSISVASSIWQLAEPLLTQFASQYADERVSISYRHLDENTILTGIWNGTVDVALTTGNNIPNEFEWTPVFSCPLCIVAADSAITHPETSIPLSSFKNSPFVCNDAGVSRQLILQVCKEAGFEPNIAFESNEGQFAGSWLEKLGGVSLVSAYDVMNLYRSGIVSPIRAIRIQQPEPMLTLGLVRMPKESDTSIPHKGNLTNLFFNYAVEFFSKLSEQVEMDWQKFWFSESVVNLWE